MQQFVKKYQPQECKEVEGQDKAIHELKNFIANFKKQKKKAVLLYGPSGVGKTCSVYSVANDFNYEVLEVNASMFRNKEQINLIVGNALHQKSLFAAGKIILVDEIDGLSGREDRGGVQAICSLIAGSPFPIVMTAMNPYMQKLNPIRNKSSLIEFDLLKTSSVCNVLTRICKKENITYEEDALKTLSRRCGGDLRGAINDLQAISGEGRVTKESVEELSERNKIETILNALLKIFKTTDADVAKDAFENVEEDINEQFLWIDENLPKEYERAEDLAAAYDRLSKADVYRGRIRRWQHWRFLVYINTLLTAGIATSKKEKNKKIIKYSQTGRLLKIFWANQKLMKKKAIAVKIAKKTHCSKKRALQSSFPYMQHIFKNNKGMAEGIAYELDLNEDEVEWLKK